MSNAARWISSVALLATAVLLPASAVVAAEPAPPALVTSMAFGGPADDPISQGVRRNFTAPGSTFDLRGDSAQLQLVARKGAEEWEVDIRAPRGERLRPGVYRDVQNTWTQTGRAPGLRVSGHAATDPENTVRSCQDIWGQFTIHQLEVDANDQVTVLDANYTQRCHSETAPALTGNIKYRALPLSFQLASEPDDYVGGGINKTYLNSTSIITSSGTVTGRGVGFLVSGLRDEWRISIGPEFEQELRVGTFPKASSSPQSSDIARLEIFGNGRSCGSSTGSFTVHSLVKNADGTVKQLHVSGEQRCAGATAALRFTLRYFA